MIDALDRSGQPRRVDAQDSLAVFGVKPADTDEHVLGLIGDADDFVRHQLPDGEDRVPFRVEQQAVEARFFVGYAGWGQGQLQREMDEGSWVIFELPGFTTTAAGSEQSSLAALRDAPDTSYFKDGDTLWVKLVSVKTAAEAGPGGPGPGPATGFEVSR